MRQYASKIEINPQISALLKDITLNHIIQSRWEDIYRLNDRFIECSSETIQVFTEFIEREFTDYQTRIYGSSIFGMYLEGSDINIALEPTGNAKEDIISKVQETIVQYPFYVTIKKLNKYTLEIVIDPLYEMRMQQQNYLPFNVAITLMLNPYFNINVNIKSTGMIERFLENKPVLRVVLIMLKKIMMNANLMNKFEGGINSYCLFLMLASYVTYFQINCHSISSASLFAGMVNFYAEHFDPSETVIYFNRLYSCFMKL
jgi:DNA polymerase sigma